MFILSIFPPPPQLVDGPVFYQSMLYQLDVDKTLQLNSGLWSRSNLDRLQLQKTKFFNTSLSKKCSFEN